jgi:restriction system protein
MSGAEFQVLLANIYEARGYTIKRTPLSGDHGADVVAERAGERIVVQAKRWNQNVGVDAVRTVFAAKTFYDAKEAVVVCSAGYTSQAVEEARTLDVQLIARDTLIRWLRDFNA